MDVSSVKVLLRSCKGAGEFGLKLELARIVDGSSIFCCFQKNAYCFLEGKKLSMKMRRSN